MTNQYLPKPGATGLCVHQIAKCLAMQGHNVWTVCYADACTEDAFDGVKLKTIVPPTYMNGGNTSSVYYRRVQYVSSLISKFVHIKNYPLRSKKLVRTYYNAVEELLTDLNEFTIIASYTPL